MMGTKSPKGHLATPHDAFFKKMLSQKAVAIDFFKEHLPKSLQKQLQWDSLELAKGSFIDDELKHSACDILYKVQLRNQDAFLYSLLEHQSQPDPLMAFRMLKYTVAIMGSYLEGQKKLSKKKPLPLVVPLVFYAGKRRYPYSTDVKDLIHAPEGLIKQYFLKPFKLIDLSQIDDKVSLRHMLSGLVEVVLRYQSTRSLKIQDDRLITFIQAVDEVGRFDLVEFALQYILTTTDRSNPLVFIHRIVESVQPEMRGKIMSMAERLQKTARQEGIEKGAEQKAKQIAIDMIKEGTELVFIAKVTKLSIEEIKRLKDNID